MGGKKKQTVGYRYSFSLHMGLGRGPVNEIVEIRVGDLTAYEGPVDVSESGQLILIDAPNLFGGDSKEGGVQGPCYVYNGSRTQTLQPAMGTPLGTLPSIAASLGGDVPSFRGVTTLWYDGLVTSLNPYPKEWSFRVRRWDAGWYNNEPWYPAKAPISMGAIEGNLAIYLALDVSGSMAGSRLANMKTAVNGFLDYLQTFVASVPMDIMIVAWSASNTSILRRGCDAADIDDLQSFVGSLVAGGGTNFEQGVLDAETFFTGSDPAATHSLVFVTDGEPSPVGSAAAAAAITSGLGVSVYGFNIVLANTTYTEMLDNTADDGVPVVSGSDPDGLLSALRSVIRGNIVGMNPAHMLYEVNTNPEWGRGMPAERLDENSYIAAANKLCAEGFGLCMPWFRQESLRDFTQVIINHIGAVQYVDRETGKLTLKLLRADYIYDDLPIFTPDSGLLDLDDDDTSSEETAFNEIVGKGFDPVRKEDIQQRLHNIASIQSQDGEIISNTTDYRGIPTRELLIRVLGRDLRAQVGLRRMTVTLDRRAWRLAPGMPFRVQCPSKGIADIVLRAGEIANGTLADGKIIIKAVQDVFTVPETTYLVPTDPTWTPPDFTAIPPTESRLIEANWRDFYRKTTSIERGGRGFVCCRDVGEKAQRHGARIRPYHPDRFYQLRSDLGSYRRIHGHACSRGRHRSARYGFHRDLRRRGGFHDRVLARRGRFDR
jgi:hypothetical protein